MAGSREHTPEKRFELTDEARDLTRVSVSGEPGTFEASGAGLDAIIAALAARADLDSVAGPHRIRRGLVVWSAKAFLEQQRDFNRLTVDALEDLTRRLDAIEANLASLAATEPADQTPPG